MSVVKAYQLLRKGFQGFLYSILETRNVGVKLKDILVVREFPNNLPSVTIRGVNSQFGWFFCLKT